MINYYLNEKDIVLIINDLLTFVFLKNKIIT